MKKRTNTYTAQHRNAFMNKHIPFIAGFIEGLASVTIALIYAFKITFLSTSLLHRLSASLKSYQY